MKVERFHEVFDSHFELLPCLTVGQVKCGNCDEAHGWSVQFAWLCFAAGVAFVTNP
jgi:hypothetical protein